MSRRRPPGLTHEDAALWSAYTKTIAPLRGQQGPPSPAAKSTPEKKTAPKQSRQSIAAPASGNRTANKAEPGRFDPKTRRNVVRGRMRIDASIDLHGMYQSEAHQALDRFIHRASAAGHGLVLVITGKGRPDTGNGPWWEAQEKGILRRQVPEWLRQPPLSRLVIGFESAARGHGGDGALYVRLRRKTRID